MKNHVMWLTILYAHTLLIQLPIITDGMAFLSRYSHFICSAILFAYIISHSNMSFIKKYKNVNIPVGLFVLGIIITSLKVNDINMSRYFANTYNNSYDNNGSFYGLTIAFAVLTSYFFIEYVIEKNVFRYVLNSLFKVVLFYIIINDVILILTGVQDTGSGYFVGNKFTVSYLHMFLAVLYNLKSKLNNSRYNERKYIYYLLFSLIISIYVQCSTAIIGTLLLLIVQSWGHMMQKFIYNKLTYIILIVVCVCFAFMYSLILDIPWVQYIIVDILGEDLTLTGRTYIYDTLLDVININPIWGFGVGNSYQLLYYLFGYPNSQNGFINLFIEQGAVGCVTIIILIMVLVNRQINDDKNNTIASLLALTISLIAMSSIEITINLFFFGLLSLLIVTEKTFDNRKIIYSIYK